MFITTTMKTITEILEQIPDESERKHLIDMMGIVWDPLSRDILGRMASPRSPIRANDALERIFGQPKVSVLARTYKMIDAGLVQSKFVSTGDGMSCKEYSITEYGRKIAWEHAKYEIARHSKLLIEAS